MYPSLDTAARVSKFIWLLHKFSCSEPHTDVCVGVEKKNKTREIKRIWVGKGKLEFFADAHTCCNKIQFFIWKKLEPVLRESQMKPSRVREVELSEAQECHCKIKFYVELIWAWKCPNFSSSLALARSLNTWNLESVNSSSIAASWQYIFVNETMAWEGFRRVFSLWSWSRHIKNLIHFVTSNNKICLLAVTNGKEERKWL